METVLVYDSTFGNTQRLAQVMAEATKACGPVRLFDLDNLLPDDLGTVDLLIVGGPTESQGLTARMRQFTDELVASPGSGTVAVTFDTRYRMAGVESASAAKEIADRLKHKGIHVFLPPESFFITGEGEPQLESGEAERAARWANHVARDWGLSRWCAA